MGLDLRVPLGLLFLAVGGLLLGYGCVTLHSPIYARSMGQNVNVIWGAILFLFGALMLLLARRSHRASVKRHREASSANVSRRVH